MMNCINAVKSTRRSASKFSTAKNIRSIHPHFPSLSLIPSSLSSLVSVIDGKYGKALSASTNIKANKVILTENVASDNVLKYPNRFTVRKYDEIHLNVQSNIRYTNHSFSPNACVKFPSSYASSTDTSFSSEKGDDHHLIVLESKSDINKGEEITFDYTTTEINLAEPFTDDTTGKRVA